MSTDKLCTVSKIENHPLDLPNDTFVAEMFEGLELPELDALVPGPKIGQRGPNLAPNRELRWLHD